MPQVTSFPCSGGRVFTVPISEMVTTALLSVVIFIIDASASMSFGPNYWWNTLSATINEFLDRNPGRTIVVTTFDTVSQTLSSGSRLSSNIRVHGGGGTNIGEGIRGGIDHLVRLYRSGHRSFDVVFCSDGDGDTRIINEQRSKIPSDARVNFFTVGFGTGFPTRLSQQIRELFHTGINTIPPCFLVESSHMTNSEIRRVSDSMVTVKEVSISDVKLFPWDTECRNTVFEGSHVFLDGDAQTVDINGTSYDLVDGILTIEFVEKIARYLIGRLHILNLQKIDVKVFAATAYALVDEMFQKLTSDDDAAMHRRSTFHQRLKKRLCQENAIIQKLLAEIKRLMKGESFDGYSDAELAQRLSLNQLETRFSDKARSIRGITKEDFEKFIKNAIDIIKSLGPKLDFESSQPRSVVTLENIQSILVQSDIIQALEACKNAGPWTIAEEFPLMGHSVVFFRKSSGTINPWLIRTNELMNTHQVLDLPAIKAVGDDGFSIGSGEKEKPNSVIPLFGMDHMAIQPFFKSDFWKMVTTYAAINSIDTKEFDAHLAMLASLLVHLVPQDPSSRNDDLLALIDSTAKVVYRDEKPFEEYIRQLQGDEFKLAMVTEIPTNSTHPIKTKCPGLSKAYFFIWFCVRNGLISKDRSRDLLLALAAEFFGRNMDSIQSNGQQLTVGNFWEITAEISGSSFDDILFDPSKHFTIEDAKKAVETAVSSFDYEIQTSSPIEFKTPDWIDQAFGTSFPVTFGSLKALYSSIGFDPKELDDAVPQFIFHALKNNSSYGRMTTDLTPIDPDYITKELTRKQVSEKKRQDVSRFIEIAIDRYCEWFYTTHKVILPYTADEIVERGGVVDEKYNLETGLSPAMCQSPDCPWHLHSSPSLAQHVYPFTLRKTFIVALHKTIAMNYKESTETIYQMVMAGNCVDREKQNTFDPENVERSSTIGKITVMEKIRLIQQRYREMWD